MNLDLTIIERDGYTFIDVLSDIGGIQGIIGSTFGLILSILNYNHFDNYMVSRLFKLNLQKKSPFARLNDKQRRQQEEDEAEWYKPSSYCGLREFCRALICRCKNCNRDRKLKAINKARRILERETEIVDLIQMRRFLRMALNNLLNKDERDEIKKRSHYVIVGPSDDENYDRMISRNLNLAPSKMKEIASKRR